MLTYVKLRRFNNHDDCYLELKKQSLFIIFCLDHQSSEDRQRKSLLWCAYLRLFADDDDSLVCISKSIIQVDKVLLLSIRYFKELPNLGFLTDGINNVGSAETNQRPERMKLLC